MHFFGHEKLKNVCELYLAPRSGQKKCNEIKASCSWWGSSGGSFEPHPCINGGQAHDQTH